MSSSQFKLHLRFEESTTHIWTQFYENISPPKFITGDNPQVVESDKRCFTYICRFINIQDRAINFTDTEDFSILLCENLFSKGPGTVLIKSHYENGIVIDKFCSFESKTSSQGQFTDFSGHINSTILQGSIYNGGNSSQIAMICQDYGNSSLSKTNITNCICSRGTGFIYDYVQSTTNVSFCNFENLEATVNGITGFISCPGNIERCNYINNSQKDTSPGLVFVWEHRLYILDSSFHNLKDVPLFYLNMYAKIYLIRCHVDNSTTFGFVDTAEMTTNSFINELEFYIISPCEGKLILRNQDKKDSIFKNLKFIALISLYKSK